MKMRVILALMTLLASAALSACSPSQAGLGATATRIVANILATAGKAAGGLSLHNTHIIRGENQ